MFKMSVFGFWGRFFLEKQGVFFLITIQKASVSSLHLSLLHLSLNGFADTEGFT